MAITKPELAKHWGTARAYAYKCVEKGCPLDSFEAADKWRRTQSQRGSGTRTKKNGDSPAPAAAVPTQPAPAAPPPPADSPPVRKSPSGRLDSLQDARLASIEVQSEAYRLVLESINSQAGSPEQDFLGIRIAAYNKAAEGRMTLEERVLEYELKAERLIPPEKAMQLISRALLPLVSRLWNIGKIAASKANPSDPVLAEAVFSQLIRQAVKDTQTEAFPLPLAQLEAAAAEQTERTAP